MPAGALVTVPPPLPAVAAVSVNCRTNVAVADCADDTETTHAAVPEQAPLHPLKRDVASGLAVNVTCAPESNFAEQVPGQEMPDGELVTVPPPLPAVDTVSAT